MTVRDLRRILFQMDNQDDKITIKDLERIFQIEKAKNDNSTE